MLFSDDNWVCAETFNYPSNRRAIKAQDAFLLLQERPWARAALDNQARLLLNQSAASDLLQLAQQQGLGFAHDFFPAEHQIKTAATKLAP